jgi:hypothetical protein
MALKLPDFAKTKCRFLGVCGALATKDTSLLKRFCKQKPLEGRFGTSGHTGFIRVAFQKRVKGVYLHIDVASREIFGDRPPKPNAKIAELRRALNLVEGQKIEVDIRGLYAVALSDLPDIVRSTLAETQVGNVSLKTRGGSFAVRGAPVYRLDWWIPDNGGDVRIELNARTSTTIDDSYLKDCCALMDSAFAALFFKG